VAVTALWTSNRLLLAPAAEAASTASTPIAARETATPAQPAARITPPRRRSIDLRPLGPIEHVPVPEEVPDLSAPPWADPELAVPTIDTPTIDAEPPLDPRSVRRTPPPGEFLPRPSRPTSSPGPELPPGFPPERTFRRLADSVAPGVHRCMRTHSPDLAGLTVELTIGGPRRSAVEMVLKEADTPALRACIAPLLARVAFPASERTARYSFTYKP